MWYLFVTCVNSEKKFGICPSHYGEESYLSLVFQSFERDLDSATTEFGFMSASSTGFSVRERGTQARTGSEYGAGTRGTGSQCEAPPLFVLYFARATGDEAGFM